MLNLDLKHEGCDDNGYQVLIKFQKVIWSHFVVLDFMLGVRIHMTCRIPGSHA
jgi:hypothetical protein